MGIALDVGGFVGVLVGILAIAVAIGIAWPIIRSKTTTATIELLRSELAIERDARVELARRCGEDTAELRGQVNVLSGAFAQSLADRVAIAVAKNIADTLGAAAIVDRRRRSDDDR
jgi:hypothetical protein